MMQPQPITKIYPAIWTPGRRRRLAGDVIRLAATIEGNAAPCAYGEEAALALAWTARNRLDRDPQRKPLAHHLQAYSGPQRPPTATSIRIARQALAADRDADPTDGRIYALAGEEIAGYFEPIGCTQRRLDAIRYLGPMGLELWIARYYPAPPQEAGK